MTVALLATMLTTFGYQPEQGNYLADEETKKNRAALKGLEGVYIDVPTDELKTLVELKLRTVGLKVAGTNGPGSAKFPVLISLAVYVPGHVQMYLIEHVRINRNGAEFFTETWKAFWTNEVRALNGVMRPGIEFERLVRTKEEQRRATDEAITQFCNDYLAANPKKDAQKKQPPYLRQFQQ